MIDLFKFFMAQRGRIINLFWVGYGFLGILFIIGGYSIFSTNQYSNLFYWIGKKLGDLALFTFCLLLLPGILRRFEIRLKWVSIIMWFRRQLGIEVFLLSYVHYSFLRVIPMIANGQSPLSSPALFELFGLGALTLFFPLFLTSNDTSIRVLKKHWYTLHKLVYIIAWLIFGHVILQQYSLWSVLVGITAGLEIISLGYSFIKSKRN